MDAALALSIVATTLAVASFGGALWRYWRDRPRLRFYVTSLTFTDVPHFGTMNMVQFLACNVGYRPLILTRCMAFGENSAFQMGIDDEPSAAIGRQDQKFPVLLDPGRSHKFHPIGVDSLVRNQADPNDPKVHFSPFKYFVLEDSFGRYHPIDVEDILRELHLPTSHPKVKGLKKFVSQLDRKRFLRKARRRFGK